MKNSLPLLFILGCSSLIMSCSRCPINISKWQTETKSKDITSQIKSLDDLSAAIKLDSIELRKYIKAKVSGNANVKLNYNLDKVIKKKSVKETIWDKELWQEATLAMNGYCAVRQDLKDGILKTEAGLTKAEEQLGSMRDFFDRAKKKLEQQSSK